MKYRIATHHPIPIGEPAEGESAEPQPLEGPLKVRIHHSTLGQLDGEFEAGATYEDSDPAQVALLEFLVASGLAEAVAEPSADSQSPRRRR